MKIKLKSYFENTYDEIAYTVTIEKEPHPEDLITIADQQFLVLAVNGDTVIVAGISPSAKPIRAFI